MSHPQLISRNDRNLSFLSVKKTKIITSRTRFSLQMPAGLLDCPLFRPATWSILDENYSYRLWEETRGNSNVLLFFFFFPPEFSEWQTSRSGYCLLLPFWSSWSNYQDTILTRKSHVLLSKPISRKRPPAECQLHLLPLRWPRFLTYRILHRRSAPWLWWGCWASWCFAFFVAHRCGQRLVT